MMNTPSEGPRPQCHFISNTHWDREWRYSMQRTRHMLVYMLDMLLDILEKEPGFRSFHLDSQAVPVQDYLEIRPEREELIRKHVREKRLLVGPWFVLPDEFCVGGESLIRNLLLGHRIARGLGHVSKTGYSPFSWGQISQMPQIYRGFGIPMAAFYRGVNTLVSPNSEFVWEGPDGSRLVGSRLGQRPRYNVWYVVQRPVYWGMADENYRQVAWGAGHAPFRFADPPSAELDTQYAHPSFEYHAENVAARARQALAEQDDEWTTPHRFWSAGHDSSCPDVREVRMIADCDAALGDEADVFHSTFEDFQRAVCESVDLDRLPAARGEMRHYYTPGSSSQLFGWIISARMDVKQDNYVTERALGAYAEPLAVFASLLGAPFPRGFLDCAWNWLLRNHGHDSIGGCSRDVVPEDMFFRSRQAREISACLTERALMDIAGAVDLSARSPEEVAVVAWNPTPLRRTEVVELALDVPGEIEAPDFEIVDEAGNVAATQVFEELPGTFTLVQSPNDCANMMQATRNRMYAELADVPAMGYRTFFVKPLAEKVRRIRRTMVSAPQTMENEHLAVTVQPNGALAVTHKATGRAWKNLGYFRDSSEVGNPWEHHPVAHEAVFTTLNEAPTVSLVREGELAASFRVEFDWALPRGRSADETRRHEDRVPCRIVNTVTLRRGRPWVEILTEVDNTAEDHYLQVSFPTDVKADHVAVQTPFDVVTRPIPRPDPAPFGEEPQTEHPMDRFVDISDGEAGFALLNEGLKAYEAHEDASRTLSLTLLRCFPLRICVTNVEMTDYSKLGNGSQCQGRHTFRYALLPHAGDAHSAGLWQLAERFCHDLRVVQIGPTPHGMQPPAKSFLEVEPEGLHVSAVKQSETGRGWVVRLFNPAEGTVSGRLRLNGGLTGPRAAQSPVERVQTAFALPTDPGVPWPAVRLVSLEEVPEADLAVGPDGWVAFEIAPKKILTIEFASTDDAP
jgi:mannosylglycerate hydrolase